MYEDTLLIICVKWYENLRLQVGDVSLLGMFETEKYFIKHEDF
jgi:hypothetical protein